MSVVIVVRASAPPRASVAPGVLLSVGVAGLALTAQVVETRLFGRAWLEALVLAILIGTAIRTAWTPSATWRPGISVAAKLLLEIAVLLLGATVGIGTILSAGPWLLAGIAAIVVCAIGGGYGIGRLLGLRHRLALLIACGNAICGNSAIAAIAPVIDADGEEVATSIAFTAALGVAVVLGLPMLVPMLHLTATRYGVLAGLTVYAVPQVLAAAAPMGAIAVQIGTLVKLVRVLMLGPVVFALSMVTAADRPAPVGPKWHHMVPWFIVGFFALAGVRSAGLIPVVALPVIGTATTWLTIVSMAALGLSTDLGAVFRSGPRVVAAAATALLGLGAMSLLLIRVLGL